MRWEGPDGYWVSDDTGLVDIGKVHAWMSEQSYWASGLPFVTDYATFGWLCDVFVDSGLRGGRLGTFLVETAVNHPAMRGVRQVLMAEPGRSIYRRQGFTELVSPERWMERPGRLP